MDYMVVKKCAIHAELAVAAQRSNHDAMRHFGPWTEAEGCAHARSDRLAQQPAAWQDIH